jgi:hypothetical protein
VFHYWKPPQFWYILNTRAYLHGLEGEQTTAVKMPEELCMGPNKSCVCEYSTSGLRRSKTVGKTLVYDRLMVTNTTQVTSKVLTKMNVKINVLSNVTPCSMIGRYVERRYLSTVPHGVTSQTTVIYNKNVYSNIAGTQWQKSTSQQQNVQ